jgi:protocatechuate 3,4-dioxygenase beta subunit
MAVTRQGGFGEVVNLAGKSSPLTMDLELLPTDHFTGRVLRPDGSPAAGAQLALVGDEAYTLKKRDTIADSNGAFDLQIPPGAQQIAVAYTAKQMPTSVFKTTAASLSSSVTLQFAEGRSIAGVVEKDDGTPLPQALVYADSEGVTLATTYSGPDGKFSLGELTTAAMTLHVQAQSDDTFDGPMLTEGTSSETITLRAPRRYTLSGKVVDEAGKPVAHVDVIAHGTGWRGSYGSTTTDDDGQFTIRELFDGKHRLQIAGNEPWTAPEQLADAGTDDAIIHATRRTLSAVKLMVQAVDATSGNPRTDFEAAISYNPKNRPTRMDNGKFVIDGMAPGESLDVKITAPGCLPVQRTLRADETSTEQQAEVVLGPPGALEGVVCNTDAARTPVPNAQVNVYSADLADQFDARRRATDNLVYTDANGRFRKENLAPGEYVMELTRGGSGARAEVRAWVVPEATVQAPALLVESAAKQSLRGQVWRLVGVPDVRVVAKSESGETTETVTRPDGTYDLPELAPQTYRMSVNPDAPSVGVGGDNATPVNFLAADCGLNVKVMRGSRPLTGAQVQLTHEPLVFRSGEAAEQFDLALGNIAPQVTRADGVAQFSQLLPGRWHATVRLPAATSGTAEAVAKPGLTPTPLTPLREQNRGPQPAYGWTIERDVSVGPQASTTSTIDVPAASLRGRVLDGNGTPLPRAKICVRIAMRQKPSETRNAYTVAGGDGRFSIDALTAGRYAIQAISEDGKQFGSAENDATEEAAELVIQTNPCNAQINDLAEVTLR